MKSPRIRRILKAKGFSKRDKHVFSKHIICTNCNGTKKYWGWSSTGYCDNEVYNVETSYEEHDCKRCDNKGMEEITEFIIPNMI